eukprot:6470700-Amphidinium_carterae.1
MLGQLVVAQVNFGMNTADAERILSSWGPHMHVQFAKARLGGRSRRFGVHKQDNGKWVKARCPLSRVASAPMNQKSSTVKDKNYEIKHPRRKVFLGGWSSYKLDMAVQKQKGSSAQSEKPDAQVMPLWNAPTS